MKFKLLIIALALCLLPAAALAELKIEPEAGVIRSGSAITLSGEYEEFTISGSESDVWIIVESGVAKLTLNNASITAPDNQDALVAEGSLQLHLIENSSIAGGPSYHDGGRGIVLPAAGKLTINGDGSLNVSGGDALYERDESAIEGTGGTAIVGNVTLQGDVRVTATGGSGRSGYWENDTWGGNGIDGNVEINGGQLTVTGGSALNADSRDYGGHGINGNAIVNSGQLTATGGQGTQGRSGNRGGDGVHGSATVNGGQLTATGGQASENSSTYNISIYGGHGVYGDAEINGGQLTATGGQASGGEFTDRSTSGVWAGHGINGNAVVNGGRLIATGNSASSPKALRYIIGGNGINGAFTAAGGYVLAIGGEGNSTQMGKAAASTEAFPVTIGSSVKRLAAAVGEGKMPNERLNSGEFYTKATDETKSVSGKRLLETREYFAVTYVCIWDGCGQSAIDYADCSKTYEVKNPESFGFESHGLAFAGFTDIDGNIVGSLTVSEPITLYAAWKPGFSFAAGEGGTGDMPQRDEITFDGWVSLPECGFNAPEGYRFAGWMIDGDDKIYAVGDKIFAGGNITLTAVWERIPDIPDTGDSGMPVLWLLLCLGACVSLLWLRRSARNSHPEN